MKGFDSSVFATVRLKHGKKNDSLNSTYLRRFGKITNLALPRAAARARP